MEVEKVTDDPSARDPMSWLKVQVPNHVTQSGTDVNLVAGLAPSSSTVSGEFNDDQERSPASFER
jgi:hypothetical protein